MPPAPVAQVLPLAGRLTQAVQLSLVLPEARHQPAAGATAATRLVGLRRSLVSVLIRKYRLISAPRVICGEDHADGAADQADCGGGGRGGGGGRAAERVRR